MKMAIHKFKKRKMEGKMKNRHFLRMIAPLTMALVMFLSACGQGGESNPPQSGNDSNPSQSEGESDPGSAGEEQVEIEFSFWGNQEEIDNKLELIAEFEKQNPNIKVKPVYTDGGQYVTKMQTWFSSGQTPDAMGVAADNIYDFVNTGMFESLTPYIERDGLSDAWAESASDSFTYGGEQYGLPHSYNVYCIAYNKALFDEAGLDYPTPDWTLDEFTAAMEKLTKGEGTEKVYGFGGYGAYAANEYVHVFGGKTYGWDNGFEIFPNGTEDVITALEYFKEQIDKGFTPAPDSDANNIGFESGRYAMFVAAPWYTATWQEQIDSFEWDLVTFPKVEGGAWYSRSFLNGMAIPAASEHKEEAWELIKWLCANEDAQAIASKVAMPNMTAYATSEEFLNSFEEGWQPYNKQAYVDSLEHTWMVQNTGAFDQINNMVYNELPAYLSGDITAQDFVAKIEEKGQELMK